MTGIEAQHRKALAGGGEEEGRVAELVGGDEDGDDPRMVGEGSDDEVFLAGGTSKKKSLVAVDHSAMTYLPFNKDFYIETEAISKMTSSEVKQLRKELDHMVVRGRDCPRPIRSFAQAGLADDVLDIMTKAGFLTPTPIQAQALPAIMSGRDVIGIAKTGSGKTLAYLLPLIRHIADQPPLRDRDGPIGLIMVPTRELCVQVTQELKRFRSTGIRAVAVYGGSDVSYQIGNLKRGCEVVVATPGRLIDILSLNSGKITNLVRVTYLVLDEADRMFDMGFAPQISRIVDNVRPSRQAVMFSATFPTSVETLARKALKNPVEIVVGGRLQVCGDVDQIIEVLRDDQKFPRLLQALGNWSDKGQVLIFTDRQEAVDTLFQKLKEQGYTSMTLHGGLDQLDRLSTISDFKSGLANVLIATSVAARGLDVRNLILVVNYDVPNHIEDYVHRVGRTGRAGRKGTAITFVTPDEERYAPALARALSESGKVVPPKLQELVDSYKGKVESGAVEDHKNDGYKTKGFTFTDEEAKQKRRMEMAVYGIHLASDDDDEDEDEDEDGGSRRRGAYGDDDDGPPDLKALEADDGITRIVSGGGGKEAPPVLNLNPEQAALLAMEKGTVGGGVKRAAEIAAMLAAKSAPQASGTAAHVEEVVKYQTEIPLNDFPQNVRFRISSKEMSDSISEMFPGVFLIVKGSYVAPGRKPMGDERKLYVELTSQDELKVKLAKKEIVRTMRELTESAGGFSGQAKERYAKYSVL